MLAPPELKNIHPLGKSPVVTVTPPGAAEPIVLAESAFILQYLCDHFPPKGSSLVPQRWKDGQENKVGGETDEWMRYQYLLYYIEGSFMFTMVMNFILSGKQVCRQLQPLTAC
jgi:glutathione S-transferase